MSRRFALIAAVAAIFLLAGVLLVEPGQTIASKPTMNIKFSTWHPPAGKEVQTVWTPMLEELKKRSEGRITYTMYAGGALGKGPEHYDIVKNGLSDMGYFTATWTPGRFPLSDVLSLATWVDGKDLSTDIGNAMYQKVLKSEFPGVKMLELNGCIQSFVWTKKPVKNLADLKGMKLRAPGGHQTNYIKSVGAEPVFMPLGEVYMAMETGTIDGLVTCAPLVLGFKLNEVAKNGAVLTFGCVTEGVIMNQNSWNKAPDDLKKIIDEVTANPFRTTKGLNRDVYKEMMKELQAKGVALNELSKEEQARWFEKFEAETEKWVASLESKGLKAKEVVTMYDQVAREKGSQSVAVPKSMRSN